MALPKEAWGNTAGWVIASVVAAGTGLLVFALAGAGAMTPPTELGRDPARWSTVAQPTDPAAVLADVEFVAGDAGRIYRQAADALVDNPTLRRRLEQFAKSPREPLSDTGPLDDLVRATPYQNATIFADDPAELLNYDRSPARLDALFALGSAANAQASLLAGKSRAGGTSADADRARELHRAAYALGRHLYEERVIHRELEYGYRLMGEALGGLAALAQVGGDEPRADELRQQRSLLTAAVRDEVAPVWAAIGTVNDVRNDRDPADLHVGDVATIAASDEADPMWRAEALLRLGKYRFDATRRADRLAADRQARAAAESVADPRLRPAAQAAAALTQDEVANARYVRPWGKLSSSPACRRLDPEARGTATGVRHAPPGS